MPYLVAKGYCRNCKRVTQHRFSLTVKCFQCKLESTQAEYHKGEQQQKQGCE